MRTPKWIKNSIIYHVYPQSFNDTNSDGIGDIRGVIEKLDYIKGLGCNIIWMNPIFESPFRDAGYDVTDFKKIAPRYGTNEDIRTLCSEAKKRDMHIILDLVAGHTALECEWFQKSAEYDKNEYSNRYIWTNGIGDLGDGSFINGYSERDGSYMKNYYYCQPALNYGFANPEKDWQLPIDHPDCIKTREAILDIMDFWFTYGVDGFRVDMAYSLVKNDPDYEVNIKVWQDMTEEFKRRHPESLIISEWGHPEKSLRAGFDMDFLMQSRIGAYTTLLRHERGMSDRETWVGHSYFRKEGLGDFSLFSDEYLDQLEKTKNLGYMCIPSGSHDLKRTSLGRDSDDLKVFHAFMMTMPGVPLIYYGDEIGMRYIEGMRSVEGAYKRTGSRTPMQWDNSKNYGFSDADKTYIACDPESNAPTVENQEKDPDSLLNHMKMLINLRKSHPTLQEDGEINVLATGYPVIYERSLDDEVIRVIINPSDRIYPIEISADEILAKRNVDVENSKIKGRGYLICKIGGTK